MRIGTANNYDNALEQLFKRQSDLSGQQEKLGSGLRVNRASDDPIAVVQAERAMLRIDRIEVEQRALEAQRSALATAESALGEAVSLLQGARDHVIAAGNPAYSAADRGTLAKQMVSLREQLFTLANRGDSNGTPLFGGLGSAGSPFADLFAGVQYQALAGQHAPTTTALPGAMNGQAIWMDVASGNGVFELSLGGANTGSVWTDTGRVVTPAALTGNNYSVSFSVVAGVTSYDVVNTTTASAVLTAQPYLPDTPIQFDGMSMLVHGQPQNGDTLTLTPSTRANIFNLLDDAIASIDNAPSDNKLSQAVALALEQIDSGMDRLQIARGQAGDWLNRADGITSAQESNTITLEAARSRAIDLDMAKGISDFNKFQTGYQAALQSYAQIQRLSLFNFIN